MDPRMVGLIGGIFGGVIGLIGAAVGTACSIVNTQSRAEKRFMIRCSVIGWVSTLVMIIVPIGLFLAGVIPSWVCQILWGVYMTAGLSSIPRLNRRVAELRQSQPTMLPE